MFPCPSLLRAQRSPCNADSNQPLSLELQAHCLKNLCSGRNPLKFGNMSTVFEVYGSQSSLSKLFLDLGCQIIFALAVIAHRLKDASTQSLPLFWGACTIDHTRQSWKTHGVRFLVFPPVGPAVPLSQRQYVAPSVPLTFSAKPFTTSSVGPLYDLRCS